MNSPEKQKGNGEIASDCIRGEHFGVISASMTAQAIKEALNAKDVYHLESIATWFTPKVHDLEAEIVRLEGALRKIGHTCTFYKHLVCEGCQAQETINAKDTSHLAQLAPHGSFEEYQKAWETLHDEAKAEIIRLKAEHAAEVARLKDIEKDAHYWREAFTRVSNDNSEIGLRYGGMHSEIARLREALNLVAKFFGEEYSNETFQTSFTMTRNQVYWKAKEALGQTEEEKS